MSQKLFSIGQMAKICGVSIKTLRYYQEIELLMPELIDSDSGYRYYSENQIGLMSVIIGLKTSDYKITEIKEFLQNGKIDFLKMKLEERIHQINLEIKTLEHKKTATQQRLKLFDKALDYQKRRLENSNQPEIRHIEERKIITLRKKAIPSLGEISGRFIQIVHKAREYQLDIREHLLIFYEMFEPTKPVAIDFEACFVLEEAFSHLPFIRTIPENDYVVFPHEGERKEAIEVMKKIPQWFKKNPYQPAGPLEVVYLMSYYHTKNKNYSVSEVQIPIVKI